jgi:hypothetical protein
MQLVDLVWSIVGFILTLLVFSYLFGDNPLFRFVTYLFVGVASGYVAVLVIYQVILPRLLFPFLEGPLLRTETILAVVPLLLSLLLLGKLSPRLAGLGSVPMAYLVGTGAAVIVAGTLTGTLVSQGLATINLFDFQLGAALGQNAFLQLIEGIVLLIGTISTLMYFHFSARNKDDQQAKRTPIVNVMARIGQIFIGVTFGALFAGVFSTALLALINRLDFLRNAVLTISTLF